MRKPFICGNWKLNKTIREALEFIKGFSPAVKDVNDVEIGLCAQFCAIPAMAEATQGSNVGIGGQDCYWEESGAFTGEVAPSMLKDAGASYCVIGHSERRQYFGETNETVNKKTKAALAAGLDPIICIGETLEQREGGKAEAIVEDHLRGGLANLSTDDMKAVTIAYEPVWAIGTGKVATPIEAQAIHAFARSILADMFGAETADATRIQYGGSVKPDNVKELMGQKDIDGALVGGATLEAASFTALCKFSA